MRLDVSWLREGVTDLGALKPGIDVEVDDKVAFIGSCSLLKMGIAIAFKSSLSSKSIQLVLDKIAHSHPLLLPFRF